MATATQVPEQLMTVDEFERRYINKPYELWEGRLVKVSPVGELHGAITTEIASAILIYAKLRRLGRVYSGDTGFRLSDITLRAPDVAFVGQSKVKLIIERQKFLPFAPDLAVEVISPSERGGAIAKKLELYIRAQTPLVWNVYLDEPRVFVYELDKPFRVVPRDGTLDGGAVLPGLQIAVADLFPSAAVQAE